MIICAAIKFKGEIIRGHRHPDAMQYALTREAYRQGCAVEELDRMENKILSSDQGFVDSDNRFVDRAEAYKIALECGQISSNHTEEEKLTVTVTEGRLMSEDIY